MLAAAAAGSFFQELDQYYFVRNMIFCGTCVFATIFLYLSAAITKSMAYDNAEYPGRFLGVFMLGVICALVFVKLPVSGWMFLFFYIALAQLSDQVTGVCGGTCLLVLTIVLHPQATLSAFLIYLLSGLIGIAFFSHLNEDFHTGIPIGLSLEFQIVLIFGGELLMQNKKLSWDAALVPLANTIMNCILICIFLQYYINKVARKVHNQYQMVNDPEYEAMAYMKEKSEKAYYHAIHTAYLVERICGELNLDVQPAKTAAYYYHLEQERWEDYPFPEQALELLKELLHTDTPLHRKEAVVVLICDNVITTIQYLQGQAGQKEIQYEAVIRQLFEKRFSMERFADTEITLSNLRFIRQKLIEEKMYYDFLR